MLFTRKPSITPDQAAARLANRGLVLVDVRHAFEVERGRIHGAIHIPLAQLRGRLPELDRGHPVAFLCHSGARSSRATGIAIKAGYNAVNVQGGMIGWRRAGLPVTR